MKYFSLNQNSIPTDFPTAVRFGLARDRGLYLPESIPKLDPKWMEAVLIVHTLVRSAARGQCGLQGASAATALSKHCR